MNLIKATVFSLLGEEIVSFHRYEVEADDTPMTDQISYYYESMV